ncbi:glycerol-3-phosphate responsive antiterminator [Breznakiella homolactica]|uniref:Glycerol-3-phosphate responsive antiterminator n=1 Tax=Breznakiella homolactica TaxID=2798577 RepID=A0A7T7XLI1_9SPIR|nr:glycerol-3-phosphate responsive antiterminator [Breznakiella homolactica]QQO08422.1 glycerol-3-phosphate responsive antiterminator [Breznakiella homolactica]
METSAFYGILRRTPVISAVKTTDGLEKCLKRDGEIVFVLFGDVLSIPGIVSKIKDSGKHAFVHMDLIDGLAARDVAVDFMVKNTKADGILSTKANLIRRAKAKGLLTIQRFFVLDSMALINIEKQFPLEHADAVEILPGAMPKVIRRIADISKQPIIAGGLIFDAEDARSAISAGAVSVSSSNTDIMKALSGT